MKNLFSWFKQIPYRFKGSIIGISIPFLSLVLSIFLDSIIGLILEYSESLYEFLGMIYTILMVIAFPLAAGGFFFLWGDGDSGNPNIGVIAMILGFILYAVLGYILAGIIEKLKK